MMKQQQQRPGHAGMEKPPKVVAVLQALNNKNGDFEWTDVAVLEALASLLSQECSPGSRLSTKRSEKIEGHGPAEGSRGVSLSGQLPPQGVQRH